MGLQTLHTSVAASTPFVMSSPLLVCELPTKLRSRSQDLLISRHLHRNELRILLASLFTIRRKHKQANSLS